MWQWFCHSADSWVFIISIQQLKIWKQIENECKKMNYHVIGDNCKFAWYTISHWLTIDYQMYLWSCKSLIQLNWIEIIIALILNSAFKFSNSITVSFLSTLSVKSNYHFFRVTFTEIHCIKIIHIWTQIS